MNLVCPEPAGNIQKGDSLWVIGTNLHGDWEVQGKVIVLDPHPYENIKWIVKVDFWDEENGVWECKRGNRCRHHLFVTQDTALEAVKFLAAEKEKKEAFKK